MLANLRFRRHRERLYTWLIALAGIGVAVFAALLARDHALQAADEGLRREVAARAAALDAAASRHAQMVRSLAAFITTRDNVSAADFRLFVEAMRGDAAGVQALQWMPYVAGGQRSAFEQAARADFPGYQVTEQVGQWVVGEAEQRDAYFPVRLVEPVAGNEAALGHDLASGPLEADALARALANRDLAVTERMVLLQEEGVHYGVMLVAPVLARDGSLRGYVAGVFRVGDLLQAALAGLPPVGLHISVTDASGPGPERALHVFSDRLSGVEDLISLSFEPRPGGPASSLVATHDMKFGDRTWRAYFEPGPGYYAPLPAVPAWLAAAVVLLLTGVLTALLLLMQKRAQLLARASLSDGLTETANRAFCDRMLAAEWERAVRHGKHLSLVLVDIDRFTDYNAQFGPLAGDDCLRRVARALATVPSRSSDILCRYGGDRFMLVLPETDHEGARQLAERTRQAVRALRLAHPGREPEPVVTVSAVAATARPRRGDSLPAFIDDTVDLLDSPGRADGNVLLGLSAAGG